MEPAVSEQFSIVFCFMPDHLHVLAEAESEMSDLRRFMATFKQKSGHWFSTLHRQRLRQEGYYDHVLRDDELTLVVARYILENPVRAGLVTRFSDYWFSGSSRYSLEEMAEACSEKGGVGSRG